MVVFSLLHVNILNIYVLTPFLEPPYLRSRCPAPITATITKYQSRARVPMTISCLWATGFLFSGRGKHHIPIPIFQNKFGGIPSHVQSIGFNVCHSVDGRVDLLTGCNKSGADHFTMKHLSIC